MTAKTGVEKEQKKSNQQQSLKGALAEVLQKNTQKIEDKKQPENVAFPVPHGAPTGIPETQSGFPAQEKKPFEVAEEELRRVLKGEK